MTWNILDEFNILKKDDDSAKAAFLKLKEAFSCPKKMWITESESNNPTDDKIGKFIQLFEVQ